MGRTLSTEAGTGPALRLAVALCLFALGAWAQEPPGVPTPGQNPGPPVQEAPGGALTPQQNNAAKLAGLAGFVNLACPAIRTERTRFEAAITAMGVQPADLESGPLRLRAQAYIDAYRKDEAVSCARAAELFGASGRIAPGVFVPR